MRRFVEESYRYAAVSGMALLVDMATLWMLVRFLSCGYLGAATLAFLLGLWVAYVLSIRYVFVHRSLADQRAEFAIFALIGAIGLAANLLIMATAVKFAGVDYLTAKSIAAASTFSGNFLVRRAVLFSGGRRR